MSNHLASNSLSIDEPGCCSIYSRPLLYKDNQKWKNYSDGKSVHSVMKASKLV